MLVDLELSRDGDRCVPARVALRRKLAVRIREAELIVYPMGSFFTSLIANPLPSGVGQTIAATRMPKLFVPNTAPDSESRGYDLVSLVECLVRFLRRDRPDRIGTRDVLDFVLVDAQRGNYPGGVDRRRLARLGLEVIDVALVSAESAPLIDAGLLLPSLLSLAW